MTTATYTVTDKAGPRVAGRLARHGETIVLTPDEAAYELAEGTIVPAGTPVPVVVPPAAVLPTDIITVRRGGAVQEFSVAALALFLRQQGGALDFSNPDNSGHLPGLGG